MPEAAEIPQHAVDTRYLRELSERILDGYLNSEEEEGIIEKVGRDFEDAAANRHCDCGLDERGEEEVREDSDDEDGWFCSYHATKERYEMHVVLDEARLDIEANPSDFPKAIYEEICERCSFEKNKDLQARAKKKGYLNDQIRTSPPPSPAHPCVSSPFSLHHLPPEILLEIVFLAQAANPHAHLTLSHVDASLRTFINSAPLLWCQIDFLYPLQLIHLYLERSADALLRVTALPPLRHVSSPYYLLTALEQDERIRLRKFMWALRVHRHRILSLHFRYEDLFFYVSEENEILAHDFLWDGSMVKLESLYLELAIWMWRDLKPIPSSYCIKDLGLRGPWTDDYLPLFSTHLKSLIVTDNRVTEFPRISQALQATPHLTSLALRNVAFIGIAEKDGNVLNMDHLKSLSLIRTTESTTEALFRCIVAPNLVSITLHHADMPPTANELTATSQLQLFPLPQPSVRRLDVTACEQLPSFFASAFRTFPCITHLRIGSSNISAKHLLPLAPSPSYQGEPGGIVTACPSLKHLTIDNEFNGFTGVIRLIAFPRLSLGIPLESVTLRGIPVDSVVRNDVLRLQEIIPNLEVEGFDQDIDVYGDIDGRSTSDTSSEGDWASGDEEIVTAFQEYGEYEVDAQSEY